jgi:hypothetical protein
LRPVRSRPWRGAERRGDVLLVRNPFYTAKLNLAKDELLRLVPRGAGGNVLKTPWRLRCPGHEGFGPARILRTPGAVAVTIPFDSAQAWGETRYVFFQESPFISNIFYYFVFDCESDILRNSLKIFTEVKKIVLLDFKTF